MISQIIARQIEEREKQLKSLRELQELHKSIPSTGAITPRVYADIVKVLRSVGMCVVSKNAIHNWENLVLELEDDGSISGDEADKYIATINQSLEGLPRDQPATKEENDDEN